MRSSLIKTFGYWRSTMKNLDVDDRGFFLRGIAGAGV